VLYTMENGQSRGRAFKSRRAGHQINDSGQPSTPFGGVSPERTRICPLDLLQFQTDSCQTAAKRAADRRFLLVDWALVLTPRDVPRTVG